MKTFNEILVEVFKIPETDVRDELSSKDIPAWDSMNYLFFIAELEKRFGFSFTMDEAINAKCVGDLRKIVETRKTIQ
ncbi:MAG: acyl carrier protein [Patescibacteria group bacterium]